MLQPRGLRALLVDDDDSSCQRFARQLELCVPEGRIAQFASVEHAAAHLETASDTPDVVFVEVTPPRQRGCPLIEQVRARRTGALPILIGVADGGFVPSTNCRPDAVLLKPIRTDDLRAVLAVVLAAAHGRAQERGE